MEEIINMTKIKKKPNTLKQKKGLIVIGNPIPNEPDKKESFP